MLRCLFCLGVLGRYGADSIDAIDEEDIDMNHMLELYKYYLNLDDFDVKARALQVSGTLSPVTNVYEAVVLERTLTPKLRAVMHNHASRTTLASKRELLNFVVRLSVLMSTEVVPSQSLCARWCFGAEFVVTY